ncbi:MAG: PD-(D/E)XK nuclease family protein [Sandaracinaceae bacterium]
METWPAWGWAALMGAGAAGYALKSALRRWAFARRRRRGRQGEQEAERLLQKRGYRVLRRQPTRVLRYTLDGAAVDVTVRADLLAERGGRRFLVEVKTGRTAPRLKTAETRRQLLEYAHAFDVHGVLLVNADAGTVHRIGLPARRRRPLTLYALLVGVLLGALGAWAVGAWALGM